MPGTRANLRIERATTGIAAAIAVSFAISPEAPGQNAGVTIDVAECVDLASAEERFACYERHVDAARQEGGRAGTPPTEQVQRGGSVESTPPDVPTEDERRDASAESAPAAAIDADTGDAVQPTQTERAGVADAGTPDDEDRSEFVGTIASLRETVPNAYVITLANGQIWRQVSPKRYPLRSGDPVRIYQSRWGSYRLEADTSGTFIQVERVR